MSRVFPRSVIGVVGVVGVMLVLVLPGCTKREPAELVNPHPEKQEITTRSTNEPANKMLEFRRLWQAQANGRELTIEEQKKLPEHLAEHE